MGRRAFVIGLLAGGMLVAATPTQAATRPLDIREATMATALGDLARQARVDLLFDRQLVRGLNARPLRGRYAPEVALAKLLAGSGVGYRVTADGAFVLYAIPAARPVAEAGDGAIAELLVVGRRTQNVDIRRTENDIQPYRIMGRREIEASGRSTVDEFLRTRESVNTTASSGILAGETRSKIDLRGFGETSTLVLVDGRRMPFVPTPIGDFFQADINGVPLGAVERIEVLTTTAGGIYGPGAIGGVVNVVLRRDYRGADVSVRGGISTRGDAEEGLVEARLGFTPDHGATDVMLFVADGRAASLGVGERRFRERAGRRAFANDPAGYAASLPTRNGVSVVSLGGDLTLDPAFGGAALGASYTFLPIGFSGTPADAGQQLVANAGKLPFELTDDLAGKRADLTMAPHVTSGLINIRRRIGTRFEIFADGLYTRNRGHLEGANPPLTYRMGPDAPGNPFGQAIQLSLPQSLYRQESTSELDSGRATLGVIANLAGGWKASADYTVARTEFRTRSAGTTAGILQALLGRSDPAVNPFGSWDAVLAALPSYALDDDLAQDFKDRSYDLALRVAGPLMDLPGGPLTITLLAEDREDRVADSVLDFGSFLTLPTGSRTLEVRSGYAELRAPLGPSDAAMPLLRDLQVQLAVRHDRIVQRGQVSVVTLDPTERFSVASDSTTFTAGLQVTPIRALMLRGSVATGERPPTLNDLQAISSDFVFVNPPPDPRRDGRLVGSEVPHEVRFGGSLRVGSARAKSFTVGAVLNPDGRNGPRLSLDYSRIEVTHEPATFPADALGLMAEEAKYPHRVIRAPVTPADLAAGFTVGPVIVLDFASDNSGRSVVEAVDARLDWRLPDFDVGDVRLYGALTWQPKLRQSRLGEGVINRVNKLDGPLKWRGNAGVEWTRGPTVVDLNAQYYGRYSVTYADSSPEGNAQQVLFQGSADVPDQIYVDLNVRHRFTVPSGSPIGGLEARLSLLNLLDHAPPIIATPYGLGFSEYGDPRGRRVVLTLAAQF